MEHLLEMAKKLGQQIAAHERTRLLKQAHESVNEDTQAKDLLEQYQAQAEKMHQLEQQQKPVEVEDKHKLQEIEKNITTNENLKEMSRRQVDFVEMMKKVKEAIDAELEVD